MDIWWLKYQFSFTSVIRILFSTLYNDLGTIVKKQTNKQTNKQTSKQQQQQQQQQKPVTLEAFSKMAKNPIDLLHKSLTVGSTP